MPIPRPNFAEHRGAIGKISPGASIPVLQRKQAYNYPVVEFQKATIDCFNERDLLVPAELSKEDLDLAEYARPFCQPAPTPQKGDRHVKARLKRLPIVGSLRRREARERFLYPVWRKYQFTAF